MYHAVGTKVDGDERAMYSISPEQFGRHAAHLASHFAAEMQTLRACALAGGPRSVAVTLDDGYADALNIAAPLLARLNIPFTVFVCTRAVSAGHRGFLTPAQVRELRGFPGASIGSHSVNHVRLTQCTDQGLERELLDSRRYLEDLLGENIDMLSYPHGAVNRRVRDAAAAAGYTIGATSRFDANRAGRDALLLSRTDIWASDGIETLKQKLRGDWDWMRFRSADPVGR
jgi:peptidoglycan/xylan/chitin deacetylase (PgdA/CDA1 family)